MTLTGNQVRQKFLEYFAEHDHAIVKSSSLIPANDPTLYFTNAGMVQFKNTFTGQESRPYTRATSTQKCMRVSGKHNDLENVGRTARHHTFFEMLGNFSFGDYFKTDACIYAWDFLTNVLKLPKEKLWVTVFETDDEAFEIWHKKVGVPKNKIVRMGEKDNFWSMGDTGPCGPCSEIIFEQDMPCTLNNPDCGMGKCDCDKFLEIWNLVFMQYERQPDGSKIPLPKPSIDTGMGLERLTAVLQKKNSNYACDLFTPIIQAIEKIVQKKHNANSSDDTSISVRVLADHIRSSVFLIADGVLPSNEGRGYVLRRILRRAIRHGKLLGQTHPFFHRLVAVVVSEMGQAFPELAANQVTIEKVIQAEEERFLETLEKGLKLLSEEIASLQSQKQKILSGNTAFKLYDTFGFPLDLTELIAAEHQLKVDNPGFDKAMNEQKERARAGWKGSGASGLETLYLQLSDKHTTEFLGYDSLSATATIQVLIQNGKEVTTVTQGDFEFICDKTSFYAESGGQAGDQGLMESRQAKALITNTLKPVNTFFLHQATCEQGSFSVGQTIQLTVNKKLRLATTRNHTATHILHAALRKRLGTHVRQAGSLVTPHLLRFDFSHFEGITPDVLQQIETDVNEIILDNLAVSKNVMNYDDALKKGALAFFGDKYTDSVRVISVGDYSTELCGGTHLTHASEIGSFRILSESSIAAGVRRIEAITGLEVLKLSQEDRNTLLALANSLKTQTAELPDKIEKLKLRIKTQEKDIEKLKQQLLTGGSADLMENATTVNDVKIIFHQADSAKDVRQLATTLRDKIKSGIAVVSALEEEKATVVISVTEDLQKRYAANKILEPVAKLLDGRGGGKPEMAQAGGANTSGLAHLSQTIIDAVKGL